MTMTVEQHYLDYAAAAKYSGLSAMTLRRAVQEGRLRAYRPTGQRAVRFAVADLDEYMRRGEANQPGDGARA